MPKTVIMHVAKTALCQLVAKLVPIAATKRKRVPGSMKGRIMLDPSFFAPLPEDELRRWE